jgi:DNA helicase-2/ATP-dependent DNA helicase PcrA
MKLIQAGPGAGKTRRLVSLINDLLSNGVSPFSIVPMTFSREGAMEITRRTEGEVVGRTNHSFCLSVIKMASKMRGEQSPQIISETESQKLMQRAIDEIGFTEIDIFDALKAMSRARESEKGINVIPPRQRAIVQRYQDIMKADNLLDFDGILERALEELQDTEIRTFYEGLHVMVDEGQDTNPNSEWSILDILRQGSSTFTMFASPSQQIYGFRGANWDELEKKFPKDYEIDRMLENYRCTPEIVRAASVLAGDDAKGMIPMKESIGSPVTWLDAADESLEMDFIGRQIAIWQDHGLPLSQIAILVRLHQQSTPLERLLRSRGVPISIVGSKTSIFERPEAKALLGLTRLAIDPMDDSVLESIIDFPPSGIGNRTRYKIRGNEPMNWDHLIGTIYDKEEYSEYVIERIYEVLNLRETLRKIMRNERIKTTEDRVLSILKASGIPNHLYSEGDRSAVHAMYGLAEEAGQMKSLNEFAEYLDGEIQKPRSQEGVQISTLHASKGREWQAVIMPGVVNGTLPHSGGDEVEERNLAFVGMTRAKDHLITDQKKLARFLMEHLMWSSSGPK